VNVATPHILDEEALVEPRREIGKQEAPESRTIPARLRINGTLQTLLLDPRSTVLDVLREQLGLTGTKKGCDHGQCGACTVIANGRRVVSCMALAVAYQDVDIRTIEGLAIGEQLHPMQRAFVECDALQCGYCTSGQIMSAVGMLDEARHGVPSHVSPDVAHPPSLDELTDNELRERMSGNICRCGAYPNIIAAIRLATELERGGKV
jgi:xanthine dehydrogenase YagT iron-sulfur-binding subunit